MGKKYGGEVWEKIVRPDRTSSGHVTLSFPVKRADSAQLPVEHAQNTLPNMVSSGHVTSGHFLSRHFRSLPVAPPHSSSSNTT